MGQLGIDRLQTANQPYMDEGVQILELASDAQSSLKAQSHAKKGGCSISCYRTARWRRGKVVAYFRQPFDLSAETTAIAATREVTATAFSAKTEVWLLDLDSNQGPAD